MLPIKCYVSLNVYKYKKRSFMELKINLSENNLFLLIHRTKTHSQKQSHIFNY